MTAKTLKIIDISEIQSFSIKVTEEISDKYLLEFVRTSIVNQQLYITKYSRFYYRFISSSLSYEVILFNDKTSKNIPEPFIFKSLCDTTTKELFITPYYFCLFDSKQLILYKIIANILKEDIQTYIEQLYKIKIDKVTVVDEEKTNLIKQDFLAKHTQNKFDFYSVKRDSSFFIFSIFFALMLSIFIFFIYNFQNKNQLTLKQNDNIVSYEKGYTQLLRLYKKSQNESITKVVKLSNYMSGYNISINKLTYKNSKLYLLLENSSRKKLLQSIANYLGDITIQSIQFDKNTNKYTMDIITDVKK